MKEIVQQTNSLFIAYRYRYSLNNDIFSILIGIILGITYMLY